MSQNKYRVLQRIEAGGMAEVFVGEATSLQGFRKQVAIKRVLPHLAKNENFIQMFLDEARLSARLNHANIVSVFDISAHEDTYFLIMEFVDGANLKKIVETRQLRGKSIPVGEAAYICMEACRGLSYAHELADEQGQPLGIVHRDISPPNILVTKRGEVKVADFGLAKAGTQLSHTDPGVVKGKFSYLSPEAAEGLAVDARSDIFSLGIVLWEMLAGRRLFLGDTDYATVKLVQHANVPRLSPLNREVDEAFEEVLLRALAPDRAQRYQSAREFGDALAGYLFNRQMKVTSYDIATLVTEATSSELPPRRRDDAALIDQLIQGELKGAVVLDSQAPPPLSDADPLPAQAGFEDPASWFSDDEFAAGFSTAPREPQGVGEVGASGPSGDSAPGDARAGWREVTAFPREGDSATHEFAPPELADELRTDPVPPIPPAPPAAPAPARTLGEPPSLPPRATADASAGPGREPPAQPPTTAGAMPDQQTKAAAGPTGRILLAAAVLLLIGLGIAAGVGR